MIQAVLNNDYATCTELFTNFPNCSDYKEDFNNYVSSKDKSRLINLIDNIELIGLIPTNTQEIIMEGVNRVLRWLGSIAFTYYNRCDFTPTEPITQVMRSVVKLQYGVYDLMS